MAKDNAKFLGIQDSIMGKVFLETLHHDLRIQHKIKYIFLIKLPLTKYTEMDKVYHRLLKVTILSTQR